MENDDTYYLWALRYMYIIHTHTHTHSVTVICMYMYMYIHVHGRFFMEFGRCHDFRVDIVG